MNREEKRSEVERMKADFEKASTVFIVNFHKIPVIEDWELRRQVRAGREEVLVP